MSEKKQAEKKGHSWKKLGRLPWQWCPRCGLVWLRNEATMRAIRAGCEADEP